MNIEELIVIVRTDYLDDNIQGDLWDDNFMFRAFTEAERQACNRQNLLFDDSMTLTLVDGQATYALPQKVTKIEYVGFDGAAVGRLSKQEIERNNPLWRTFTGMTGKVINYVMRGHNLRFTPSPDATDAGKSIALEVFRLPKVSIDDESYIPEIPDEYHRDLIYWVLHEAYKKQDADTFQQERSDYFLSRFTQVFGEYISAEVRLNQMQQRGSLHLRPTAYATKLTRTSSNDDWD